jgi:uncharacterized phiE125 gp8 family phage protein
MQHHHPIYYEVTAEPATQPITVDEAKTNLKLTHTAEDALIQNFIEAATTALELRLRLRFCRTAMAAYFNGWGGGTLQINSYTPITSITSIQYIDDQGNTQTLNPDNYTTSLKNHRPLIRIHHQPNLINHDSSVIINYMAGYSASVNTTTQRNAVPANVKAAIQLMTAALYENREDKQLDPHKILASINLTAILQNSYF